MPRLIFAAVAINLSYWICALAVDASNLLGSSVFALLKEIGVTGLSATDLDAVLTAAMSGGSIAVGGVAAVVVAMANIPGVAVGVGLMFISAALGIVLALFIGLLILSVRQALVIILLVISPLAFALYVLPGTKPIFEKWRKLFTTMLVFYPLFALFYGGGLVASSILVSASGDTEVGPQLGGSLLTMGILVQFAVLFLSPWLIFKGTGQVGELGRNLLNKGKGLTSMPGRYGRKIAGEGMGIAGNRLQNRFKRFAAGQPNNRRGRLMRGLAFGGVRRRMAKEDAEAEVKRTDSEYAHNSMPLEAMHARTMENQEITAGLEAEGKARVLTRSPTLQSAVATRKAAELGASRTRGVIETNAEAAHRDSGTGRVLTAQEGAAKKTLGRVNKAEEALVEELSSDKGQLVATAAGLNPQLAATMQQESRSSRVQAERLGTAQRANDASFDAYISGGSTAAQTDLAIASRLDPVNGAKRIVDIASARSDQRFMESVKQAEATLSSKGAGYRELASSSYAFNTSLPPEQRVAAASRVAGAGDMQAKMDLARQLFSEMATAKQRIKTANPQFTDAQVNQEILASTDPNIQALRFMQKQIASARELPFAIGDRMRGEMAQGLCSTDFDVSFDDRIITDLKGSSLAALKPEEIGYIVSKIQQTGAGSPYALAVQAAIDNANENKITGDVKKKVKDSINGLVAQGLLTEELT